MPQIIYVQNYQRITEDGIAERSVAVNFYDCWNYEQKIENNREDLSALVIQEFMHRNHATICLISKQTHSIFIYGIFVANMVRHRHHQRQRCTNNNKNK